VELVAVAKRYGDVVALEPTDLAVEPGEFFALLGPSGSGKSTLLGTVAGFVPPSGGRIRVDGRDITGVPPYQRNIGMVFQNYTLFPHMTVSDNIAFPLRMRKVPRSEIAERVRRMLAMVRLPGMADRAPGQLSGGQQQRVALARAAVYDPPLLLMDEPLGALDKNLREEMQDEIKQFHRAVGATVLYVTHDQAEAASMADRIAILNHGRIVQLGRPRELYEFPRNAFVASFLGEANLFEIVAVAPRGPDEAGVTTREGLLLTARGLGESGGPLCACIRPETIEIGGRPAAGANALAGTVVDAVYAAGSVRYRVRVGADAVVTVRVPSERHMALHAIGAPVSVSWDPEDMLLIPLA
jgi:putative spermidine/putrescine transport system ATP-binding protein